LTVSLSATIMQAVYFTRLAAGIEMNIKRFSKVGLSSSLVALAACGSDSTGPGALSTTDAFSSLALGLSVAPANGLGFAMAPASLADLTRRIDEIDVVIDGTTHRMYALGLRVTYPAGTCFETIFLAASAMARSICTPPPLGLVLALWQTRSGTQPPDRMAFISGDIGTTSFASLSTEAGPYAFVPAFGVYLNGRQEFWMATGGTLTSQVTATNQACQAPPPPFASASTCRFATFDEAGRITFGKFSASVAFGPGSVASGQTMELVIPRQTVNGILQSVTGMWSTHGSPWDY